jgi:hypothetical protein
MTIRRIPLHNTMTNDTEVLEGELVDTLPDDHSVYVDRTGKTYNPAKGVRLRDLPSTGVTQFPRTTWYALAPTPVTDELTSVGYPNGPDGCVPILRTEDQCSAPQYTR